MAFPHQEDMRKHISAHTSTFIYELYACALVVSRRVTFRVNVKGNWFRHVFQGANLMTSNFFGGEGFSSLITPWCGWLKTHTRNRRGRRLPSSDHLFVFNLQSFVESFWVLRPFWGWVISSVKIRSSEILLSGYRENHSASHRNLLRGWVHVQMPWVGELPLTPPPAITYSLTQVRN